MEAKILPDSVSELQQKIARAEEVKRISNQIHAAKDLDQILLDMNRDILGLFDAEELTLYAVDPDKKEVYAKLPYLEAIEEMRLPIDEQSIAGFTAKYLRPVNIQDAYTKADLTRIHPALCHDSSWDKKTGFRTKQVLTYPIVAENKYLMGVVQLLNKKGEGRFTKKDEESVAEIAKSLGIAFFNLRKLAKKTVTKFDYLVASNKITQSELDAAIHIVLSAHTHRGYNCLIDGRVIIQAASYGRLISVVDIEIDRVTGRIVRERTRARNVTVPNGVRAGPALRAAYPPLAPDPKVASIVEHYRKLAAPLAQRPIGYIVADFDRRTSAGGDSTLGRLVADAQLAASRTHGAQIAFTNPGGLRADLRASGANGLVTYADAFLSQPFGNTLVTLTLTGLQLRQLLEQQWSIKSSATGSERARMLQPSRGFAYAWRSNGVHGERVVADSMRLDGRPIELEETYRVTVNNFLAEGGDGFRVLREGTDRAAGPADIEAVVAYLSQASSTQPLAPDRTPRITRR